MQIDDCVFAGIVIIYNCPKDKNKNRRNKKMKYTLMTGEKVENLRYCATGVGAWEQS